MRFLFSLLLLTISSNFLFAQNKTKVYHNLVFEGGGIKGIAYAGAIEEMEKNGMLKDVQRVAGTSAGAIEAVLLCLGYSANEMSDIVYKTPIQDFNDGRWIFIGGLYRMKRQYGWYRGEHFKNWIEKLIKDKCGDGDFTFKELHALAGKNGFKDLYVTGTDLSKQKTVVFSYETYPDMKLKDAIRVSMSIPLYYRAVFVDSVGNIVNKVTEQNKADVMVDGGIIANFPIHIFDKKRYINPGDTSNEKMVNYETIGVRLDTEKQIEYDRNHEGLAPYPINNFKDYAGAFYYIIIENLNRNTLTPEDWARTISVGTGKYGPRVKKLKEKDKETLIEKGRIAGREFFKQK